MVEGIRVSLSDCIYQPYKSKTGKWIPSVILVGRQEKDRKKVAFRKKFYPYVLIDEKSWSDSMFDLKIRGVKDVSYNPLPGMNKQAIRRITMESPARAEKMVEYLHKILRTRTHESDLMRPENLGLKYLIDSGIKEGFEVPDGDSDEIKPANVYVPLRTWFADAEVVSTSSGKINPFRDEPMCLFTYYDNYSDKYVTLHTQKYDYKPLFPNHIVIKLEDENIFVRTLVKRMDDDNPEIVAMHNGERYDTPKLIQRMEKYKIPVKLLSPKPFRHVDTTQFPVKIRGRFFLDTLKALIFFTNKDLGRYSLEYVIEKEKLPIIKIQMPYSTIELWNDQIPRPGPSWEELYDGMPEEAKKYFDDAGITKEEFRPSHIMYLRNVLDVKALQLLENKEKFIRAFDALRRSNGGLMEDVYIRNRIIDTRLLRMCSNICVLPSTNRLGGKKEKTGGFKGGYVHEPVIGMHELVALLDFKRQYPNIMISFNISPDTYVNLNHLTPEEAIEYGKKHNLYIIISHNNETIYAFKKSPLGLIPKMLMELMDERAYYEEEEKKLLRRAKETRKILDSIKSLEVTLDNGYELWVQSLKELLKTSKFTVQNTEKTTEKSLEEKDENSTGENAKKFLTTWVGNVTDAEIPILEYLSYIIEMVENWMIPKRELQVFLKKDGTNYKFSAQTVTALLMDTQKILQNILEDYESRSSDSKWKAWYTKVSLDGTFGVLGWPGFRLYLLECSAAIPCIGQYATMEAIRYLEELMIRTLYADTDSSFFKINEGMTLEELQALVSKVNEHLSVWAAEKWGTTRPPFSFALKRIYKQYLLISKKQYMGAYNWDEKKGWLDKVEFDYKGTAAIRSDTSDFEREVIQTITEMALTRVPDKEIIAKYQEFLAKLDGKDLPLHYISYPGKLKKPFEWNADRDIWFYRGRPGRNKKTGKLIWVVPSHIKAAMYSNSFLGEGWRQGDKPSRLLIDCKKIRNHSNRLNVMMRNGQCKEYELNAIAIDESSVVPKEFIYAIDWPKIKKRLVRKLDSIFKSLKIEIEPDNRKKTTLDMFPH